MNYKAVKKVQLSSFVTKAKNITLVIVLMAVATHFLPWEQTTKGTGTVIAYEPTEREYNILSPISGFVDKYYIEENKFVKRGEVLFDMIDLDKDYLEKLESIISDIKVQQKNIEDSLKLSYERKENLESNLRTSLDIYDKRIIQTDDLIKSLKRKEVSQTHNNKIVTSNYERIKLLYLDGIESKRTYEVAKNEYIKEGVVLDNIIIDIGIQSKNLEIRKKEKERFIKEQQNTIKILQNSIFSAKNKLKYFEREIKNISIDFKRNNTARVTASKDGYPLRILKNDKNLYIKKGEPIISFAPKITKKALLLKVRLLDMPLVKKGLPVRVRFHGWPSLQVSGWPKINLGTFGGIVDKVDSVAYKDGFFYAFVVEDPLDPWPNSDVLKAGTHATGWVRLSTVTIWYEIWRMRNAIPPVMVSGDKE